MTGMAMAAELADYRNSRIEEWETISQDFSRLRARQSLIPNLMDFEEQTLITGYETFKGLRAICLRMAAIVLKEFEGFGDRPIPTTSKERKDKLLQNFGVVNQKLAEVQIMHQKLLEVFRDSELKLLRTLLPIVNNLQDAAKNVLYSLQALNNENSLRDKAVSWLMKVNESRSSLEKIHLSSYRTHPDHQHQIDNLLRRFGEIHCPCWYFEFLQVVNKDIEQLQTYKTDFHVYIADVQGLIPDIEQLLFDF